MANIKDFLKIDARGCGFCHICDLTHCPKKGRSEVMSLKHVSLSTAPHKKLQKFCENKGFMRGEDYYKVPDYNAALLFLLDEYAKRLKRKK